MSNETIMWSKDNCSFCVRAKKLLDDHNIAYEERKIGENWSREQLLESVPNARTVPQIFLHGKHIGGYDQLVKYFEDHNMYTDERI